MSRSICLRAEFHRRSETILPETAMQSLGRHSEPSRPAQRFPIRFAPPASATRLQCFCKLGSGKPLFPAHGHRLVHPHPHRAGLACLRHRLCRRQGGPGTSVRCLPGSDRTGRTAREPDPRPGRHGVTGQGVSHFSSPCICPGRGTSGNAGPGDPGRGCFPVRQWPEARHPSAPQPPPHDHDGLRRWARGPRRR